jgi:hypothetical protein
VEFYIYTHLLTFSHCFDKQQNFIHTLNEKWIPNHVHMVTSHGFRRCNDLTSQNKHNFSSHWLDVYTNAWNLLLYCNWMCSKIYGLFNSNNDTRLLKTVCVMMPPSSNTSSSIRVTSLSVPIQNLWFLSPLVTTDINILKIIINIYILKLSYITHWLPTSK